MIGQTISHYKILEKIGEGGMGVVYRAEDTKLGRAVAIKLLSQHLGGDAEVKKRFVHEAKAASALDHLNICTIYEIDETKDDRIFMVMAFYEGRTVKELLAEGPLDIARAVDIAIGVSRGLERAHERGIMHRDIKPANIMVTSDGIVKIMDFGIAKLAGEATITRTGSSIGTIAYMSPEQASGGAIDHRTDIWSLGVLLYEMLTGRRSFGSDYDQAAIYAILNEEPKPPSALRRDVPVDLERVVLKAMAKSPAERFQSAGDMRAALESCTRSTAPGAAPSSGKKPEHLPSIAVLPFKDMSPQKDQDYLCEGIAEELLNALVQIEGLRVAARTSSAQFKDKAVNVQAIGRELGVQSVLEGSVRKSGDRLRITAQLINVEDGYHLWSEKYDRDLEDIFAIQDEISLAIVDKLRVKLLRDEKSKLIKRHTENEEAYRLYLQGRYFWNRRHEGGVQKGLEYFQKAIDIDPDYPLPHSGMADCYFSLGFFDFLAPNVAFGKCKEAALKAVELDPDLAEVHASLGNAFFYFDWDYPAAEAEFQHAIGLNPNYATVRYFYGMFLTAAGRFDDAVAQERRALELDPIQPTIRAAQAFTLRLADRNDEAIATSRASIEFDPNFFVSWLNLGQEYALIGKFAEAEEAVLKAVDLAGGTSTLILLILGQVLEPAGKRDEARAILDRMLELSKSKYASAQLIATLYWLFDEKDAAFEWLERAIDERDHWVCYSKYLPAMREMRSDPRIQGILRKLGLEAPP
jgi:serine/threonine protein kinase/cytochrome c-type biogenesis protein CcmH/NrfG